jgi:hypothetical protein
MDEQASECSIEAPPRDSLPDGETRDEEEA